MMDSSFSTTADFAVASSTVVLSVLWYVTITLVKGSTRGPVGRDCSVPLFLSMSTRFGMRNFPVSDAFEEKAKDSPEHKLSSIC